MRWLIISFLIFISCKSTQDLQVHEVQSHRDLINYIQNYLSSTQINETIYIWPQPFQDTAKMVPAVSECKPYKIIRHLSADKHIADNRQLGRSSTDTLAGTIHKETVRNVSNNNLHGKFWSISKFFVCIAILVLIAIILFRLVVKGSP
jgi:hypothetical protein